MNDVRDAIWFDLLRHTPNAWSSRKHCERCPEPEEFENVSLCGGCITAGLCRVCRREYETDVTVRELTMKKNLAYVEVNAFIHAGDRDLAAHAYGHVQAAENGMFTYVVEWLKQRPVRDGKTKADAEQDEAAQATGKNGSYGHDVP